MENQIEIFKSKDNQAEVLVRFEGDTVWLSQEQMAMLFERGRTTITEHVRSLFKVGELVEDLVCRNFRRTTPHGAIQGKTQDKDVKYYNLDVIISVGYQVKSIRGTQFRQWATQQLKNYLVQGYAINQKRLDELGKLVQLIDQGGKSENLQLTEAKGLLEILSNYTKSFVLLNQYDSHNIQTGKLNENISYEIQYDEAKTAIVELKKQLVAKKEAIELFGNEKDESFLSSLQSIVQTFDGQYLYPSIEAQAAHL